MPKVSVIMAVYNGEKYLREAIESILSQTFKDFEFIIVDDGSTDRTPDILKEYEKKDDRVKIITNSKNIGLTKSLNKAIKIAKGEYIARQDADDISLPERLEKQVEFMDKNRDIGLVGAFYYEIGENGSIVSKKILPTKDTYLKKILIKYNPFFHSSIIIRRKVFSKVGLYDEKFKKAQDYELWFRVARFYKLTNIPKFLIKRRYTKEMISQKNESEQIYWAQKARIKAIKNGWYSKWNSVYLLKPFLVLILPPHLRNFLRKVLRRKFYD